MKLYDTPPATVGELKQRIVAALLEGWHKGCSFNECDNYSELRTIAEKSTGCCLFGAARIALNDFSTPSQAAEDLVKRVDEYPYRFNDRADNVEQVISKVEDACLEGVL